MRVKQVWDYVPLPRKLKLVWERLTFSKLTTAYFLFSVIHCLIQLALQIRAFTINANSARILFDISLKADAFNDSVPFLTHDDNGLGKLVLCPDVPTALHWDTSSCPVVWNGTAAFNNVTSAQLMSMQEAVATSSTPTASPSSTSSIPTVTPIRASTSSFTLGTPSSAPVKTVVTTKTVAVTPTVTSTAINVDEEGDEEDKEDEEDVHHFDVHFAHPHKRQKPDFQIMVSDFNGRPEVNISFTNQQHATQSAILSSNCSWSLNYPVQVLENTKREDVVFMAFQAWVLGMSIVALLNESIPHILASLATHVMATGWAAFQIVNTRNFQQDFARVITRGACNGLPQLLGGYWKERQDAEYASLALNVAALFVSGFLSWRLFKTFGWQTFKRVGASITINRIYKLVLVLSIVLQLSFFFMGATVALWLDSLVNGIGRAHAMHRDLYLIGASITMFLLLPWVSTGYIGVRKELRIPMVVFLLLSIVYLAGWSIMFLADTFRWEFWSWRFFSVMAVIGSSLTVLAFILGIVCIVNFGKGLLRYLSAQEPLPGDDFAPVSYGSDPEKVAFPSSQPIPTFSAAFGKGSEVPVPTQMFPAHTHLGPRFFRSSPAFDSRSVSPATVPSTEGYERSSVASNDTAPTSEGASVMRTNTRASDHSFQSVASYYKYSDDGHSRSGSTASHTMQGKRWIIE